MENSPQNRGFVRTSTKVGLLTGRRYMPQANRKQPNTMQKWPKMAPFLPILHLLES